MKHKDRKRLFNRMNSFLGTALMAYSILTAAESAPKVDVREVLPGTAVMTDVAIDQGLSVGTPAFDCFFFCSDLKVVVGLRSY